MPMKRVINVAQILPQGFEMKADSINIPIKQNRLFRKFKTKI